MRRQTRTAPAIYADLDVFAVAASRFNNVHTAESAASSKHREHFRAAD